MATLDNSTNTALTLTVDHEHLGIRATGCITLLASVVVFTLVFNALFEGGLFLSVVLGIVLGVLLTNVIDRILKGRWQSGRVIHFTPERLALQKHGQTEAELNPVQQVNVLMWHFVVKRNSRVKKGWYVVAIALEQDDIYIPFYTFCSPEDFEKLPMHNSFTLLTKPKTDEKDLRLAGIMRRLLRAEGHRNHEGAEMTYDDFLQTITYLQDTFVHWMPKP